MVPVTVTSAIASTGSMFAGQPVMAFLGSRSKPLHPVVEVRQVHALFGPQATTSLDEILIILHDQSIQQLPRQVRRPAMGRALSGRLLNRRGQLRQVFAGEEGRGKRAGIRGAWVQGLRCGQILCDRTELMLSVRSGQVPARPGPNAMRRLPRIRQAVLLPRRQ